MSTSSPTTVSLYGCGSRTEALVDSVFDTGRLAVSRCYDLNADRARALAEKYGGEPVEDVTDLLSDPHSNAIVVALFPRAHAGALRGAIATGKPIYAEKPIATQGAEARELVQQVRRNNTYLRVGFVQRYVPLFEKIHEMIRAGEVGELISIKHEWLEWASPTKTGECDGYNWRSDPATGGELLQHTGHFWDVLRLWAGEFESVMAQTNQVLWPKAPSENSVFALVRHRDASTISEFHLSLSSRYNNVHGRIEGTKLTLEYEWNFSPVLRIFSGEQHPGKKEPDTVLTDFAPSHDTRRMMLEFLDDLELGRAPSIPVELGLRTLEIVEAIRRSAVEGRRIEL
jgi:predicted dehydrogenase